MRTRLELVIRQHGLKPAHVARAAGYARQHLHRLREAEAPSNRRSRLAITGAIRRAAQVAIDETAVFEPEEHERAARPLRAALAANRDLEAIRLLVTSAGESEEVVRLLIAAGHDEVERDPSRADALLSQAESAVSRLTSTPPPLATALRAHIELQRSTAMKMKGEYEAALELLARSERHFSEAMVCRAEIGTVRWALAIILFKMERLTEAAQVAQKARHISEEAGDWRGVSRARMIAGCIAAERGEIASAKRTFLELLRSTPGSDRITVARLSLNLATCDLRAGAFGSAREQLAHAAELFASLGLVTEVVRAHWLDAKITAAEGDVRRALLKFRQAVSEFENLKMSMDAGFSGLDLLELLLATGNQRVEAVRLARRLVATFVAAGTRASAASALTYLREAVAKHEADAVLVRYVTTYVRRSSVYADEPFRPPEGAAEPPTG